MKRAAIALLGAQALFGAGVHCSSTDVVVATFPPHHEGGSARPCVKDDDCHDEDFCSRTGCDDSAGQCEPREAVCDSSQGLTCGCDGVTYWNDCLRRLSGVTAKTDGPCGFGVAALCGGSAGACPAAGASCARIYPSEDRCPHDGTDLQGVCVMLPPTCGGGDGGTRLGRCGGPNLCDDECAAIRSETPHLRPGAAACP